MKILPRPPRRRARPLALGRREAGRRTPSPPPRLWPTRRSSTGGAQKRHAATHLSSRAPAWLCLSLSGDAFIIDCVAALSGIGALLLRRVSTAVTVAPRALAPSIQTTTMRRSGSRDPLTPVPIISMAGCRRAALRPHRRHRVRAADSGLQPDLPPQTPQDPRADPSTLTTADQRCRPPAADAGSGRQASLSSAVLISSRSDTRRVEGPTDPLHTLVVLGMGRIGHHLRKPAIAPLATHILRRTRPCRPRTADSAASGIAAAIRRA